MMTQNVTLLLSFSAAIKKTSNFHIHAGSEHTVLFIYKHTLTRIPQGNLPFASQFSPTSAFCHVSLICHNIHMLHFASI